MRQLIIKPWSRSLGPWCWIKKMIKVSKNLKKLHFFKKIANYKVLKNFPLHIEAIQ